MLLLRCRIMIVFTLPSENFRQNIINYLENGLNYGVVILNMNKVLSQYSLLCLLIFLYYCSTSVLFLFSFK